MYGEPIGARWLRLYQRRFPDPLGYGLTPSRFGPPAGSAPVFGVVYMGSSLNVAVAETVVRDRGDGRLSDLPIELAEFQAWTCAEIEVVSPLRLVDLRGDGPLRMGIPSDVAHASTWSESRRWSAALHAHETAPDGLIYLSRFTGEANLALYDRALAKVVPVKTRPLLDRSAELATTIRRLGLRIV